MSMFSKVWMSVVVAVGCVQKQSFLSLQQKFFNFLFISHFISIGHKKTKNFSLIIIQGFAEVNKYQVLFSGDTVTFVPQQILITAFIPLRCNLFDRKEKLTWGRRQNEGQTVNGTLRWTSALHWHLGEPGYKTILFLHIVQLQFIYVCSLFPDRLYYYYHYFSHANLFLLQWFWSKGTDGDRRSESLWFNLLIQVSSVPSVTIWASESCDF